MTQTQVFNSDGFSDNVSDTENSRIYFHDNIDEAISNLKSLIGWDNVHTCHLKYAGDSFRSLLALVLLIFET